MVSSFCLDAEENIISEIIRVVGLGVSLSIVEIYVLLV